MLTLEATPPSSCDEHCVWSWLWPPCRCETVANLSVVLPAASGLNISEVLDGLRPPHVQTLRRSHRGTDDRDAAATDATGSAATASEDDDGFLRVGLGSTLRPYDLFGRVLVSVEVEASRGSSVVVAASGGGLVPQPIDRLSVRTQRGDATIQRVVATSTVDVEAGGGIVRMLEVVGGSAVKRDGSLRHPRRRRVGSGRCAAMLLRRQAPRLTRATVVRRGCVRLSGSPARGGPAVGPGGGCAWPAAYHLDRRRPWDGRAAQWHHRSRSRRSCALQVDT